MIMENKKLSILLAEDNPISCKLAEININKMGHKLDIVNNGHDAVKSYMSNKYDVILMDIEMPIMGGLDATKMIRDLEKDQQSEHPVKIIAMTAHDANESARFINQGMDAYCMKPYKSQELRKVLQ